MTVELTEREKLDARILEIALQSLAAGEALPEALGDVLPTPTMHNARNGTVAHLEHPRQFSDCVGIAEQFSDLSHLLGIKNRMTVQFTSSAYGTITTLANAIPHIIGSCS